MTRILNPQTTGPSTAIARQTTPDCVVVPADPTAATSPTDMLWQGMQSLVREAVDQELNASLEAVAQLGREGVESELKTQSTQLQQQSQTLGGLQDAIEQRGQGAERAVSALRDSLSELADAAGAEFSELKELFRTLGQRQAEGVDALDRKLVATTKVICQRMEERYRSTLERLAGITTQSDRLAGLVAGCQEQLVAMASKQQASEERVLSVIAGQTTELRRWREEWEQANERRTSWGGWWPLLTAWARVQSRRGRVCWERLSQTALIRSSK